MKARKLRAEGEFHPLCNWQAFRQVHPRKPFIRMIMLLRAYVFRVIEQRGIEMHFVRVLF
jgi:hypothetical protein